MWLRRLFYRLGPMRQNRLSVPLIVVGNLSVGGTGKTPVVIALVQHLRESGWTPGVIARGYGGNSAFWPRLLENTDKPYEVGDEPLMIQQRTGGPVAVGPNRLHSARLLIDQLGCDIVVSDDGFQHLALARDIDIVVVDGERRLGNGWCLPAGPLREFKSVLRCADMLVVNSPRENAHLGEHEMEIDYGRLYRLGAEHTTMALTELSGSRVHAVAALGNPDRFFSALERAGLEVIPHRFPDHHAYTQNEFEFLSSKDVLIMTEKDAVKCAHLEINGCIWVLPIQAQLNDSFYATLESRLPPRLGNHEN